MSHTRTSDIGERFLRFYQQQQFNILPRGSLLDPALPMTFVGSAGLSQIESAIEQGEDRGGERYVVLQTCFRHFDMEQVGQSPVHLSLFDMGGAFAFGETDRKEVLWTIWRFLTEEAGLPEHHFWASYFTGGTLDDHQFEADRDTYLAWQQIGIPKSRLIAADMETGFWKQGGGLSGKDRFRKCGPTTELFIDRGETLRCGPHCSPGCRCGRFIEIANILFIHSHIDQYTRALHPLVTPFAETVIGVERVAMAGQGHSSVFDTEPFVSLFAQIRAAAKSRLGDIEESIDVQTRMIADYLRALLFLAADGAPPPGKGGRARIMRLLIRGVLTHQKLLNMSHAECTPALLDTLIAFYGAHSAKFAASRSQLLCFFACESSRFEKTLLSGYRQIHQLVEHHTNPTVNGRQALELVKSYGIPLVLLERKLAQMQVNFNRQDYWKAHAHWRQMA